MSSDVEIFESLRPELVALAYRMLGDLSRAEDMVQEAWLRWERRDAEVQSPKGFLVTVVTRLCLNDLESARARREESRGDRLPEPVDLEAVGMSRLEALDQVSMAFLVMLERLSPAERAALLLHDVFDFTHAEIAALVGHGEASCRKLLERAREKVRAGRRMITASREEHARLLHAFIRAARAGDVAQMVELLAEDAQLVADGGAEDRGTDGIRRLPKPLEGAARVAAFLAARAKAGASELEERELNGRPSLVVFRNGQPFAALLIAVADGKIQRIFFHADPRRLGHLGPSRRGLD